LGELEVYKLARELSVIGWKYYCVLNWHDKKVLGDQFIRAIDSVGANVAEGYGRFHYLDRIKFYYNARASLFEAADHWLSLLEERNKISGEEYKRMRIISEEFLFKLNNFIKSTYRAKNSSE